MRYYLWVWINVWIFATFRKEESTPRRTNTIWTVPHFLYVCRIWWGGGSLWETYPKMQQQHKCNQFVTLPLGSHRHLGQPFEIRYGCDHNTGANSHHVCQLAMKWQTGDETRAEDQRWWSRLDTYSYVPLKHFCVRVCVHACACVCVVGASCYFENMGLPLQSPLIYCGLRLWIGCTCAHSHWNTPTHMVTHMYIHRQTCFFFFVLTLVFVPSHSPVLSYSLSQTFHIHLLF